MATLKRLRAYLPLRTSADNLPKYSQLDSQNAPPPDCLCVNCGHPVHGTPFPKKNGHKWALNAILTLVAIALWIALISALVMVPHMDVHDRVDHGGPRVLIDQFPIVYENWEYDERFVESDPWASPFFTGNYSLSDDMASSAWNYYGNAYIYLEKNSPYSIPGGRPLYPLKEEDNWMKDYTAFITAYGHTIHCLAHLKKVLDLFRAGRTVVEVTAHHTTGHMDHCMEIVRRAIDCQPDLSLQIETFDEKGEHTPFYNQQLHRCRDREAVHAWLAERNMGFTGGEDPRGNYLNYAWSWPLPH